MLITFFFMMWCDFACMYLCMYVCIYACIWWAVSRDSGCYTCMCMCARALSYFSWRKEKDSHYANESVKQAYTIDGSENSFTPSRVEAFIKHAHTHTHVHAYMCTWWLSIYIHTYIYILACTSDGSENWFMPSRFEGFI